MRPHAPCRTRPAQHGASGHVTSSPKSEPAGPAPRSALCPLPCSEPFKRTRAASRRPAAAHEDDGAAQERLRDASPFFRGEMQGRNAPFRARIDRRLGRGRFSLLLLQTSSRTRCRNVSKKANEQKKKKINRGLKTETSSGV